MKKTKRAPEQYKLPRSFWVTTVIIGIFVFVAVAISISWYQVWRTGWPGYIHAVTKCNGKPPISGASSITQSYLLPTDEKYKIPAGPDHDYFCTEQEAVYAGYKHEE